MRVCYATVVKNTPTAAFSDFYPRHEFLKSHGHFRERFCFVAITIQGLKNKYILTFLVKRNADVIWSEISKRSDAQSIWALFE